MGREEVAPRSGTLNNEQTLVRVSDMVVNDGRSFGPEVRNLIRKLLINFREYFDKNEVLNSDGRRLLAELLRYLVYEHPEYKDFVRNIRKNPTLENIVKLAELILGADEVSQLLEFVSGEPYVYRFDSYRYEEG